MAAKKMAAKGKKPTLVIAIGVGKKPKSDNDGDEMPVKKPTAKRPKYFNMANSR